jgi:hypothetical protein
LQGIVKDMDDWREDVHWRRTSSALSIHRTMP